MYQPVVSATPRGGSPTDSGDSVVTLDKIPRWNDAEHRSSLEYDNGDPSFSCSDFPDPLTYPSGTEGGSIGSVARFRVDH